MNILPSLDILKTLFKYNPSTGVMVRIFKSGTVKRTGRIHRTGYMEVTVQGKLYMLHRVAWYLHTDTDPEDLQVDHKDRDKLNNKFNNLRLATQSQNNCNRVISKNSSTKSKGIDFHRGKYRARIRVNNTRTTVGYFSTLEKAKEALAKARKTLHKEYAFNG